MIYLIYLTDSLAKAPPAVARKEPPSSTERELPGITREDWIIAVVALLIFWAPLAAMIYVKSI